MRPTSRRHVCPFSFALLVTAIVACRGSGANPSDEPSPAVAETAVSSLLATGGVETVTEAWSAVSGATSYEVALTPCLGDEASPCTGATQYRTTNALTHTWSGLAAGDYEADMQPRGGSSFTWVGRIRVTVSGAPPSGNGKLRVSIENVVKSNAWTAGLASTTKSAGIHWDRGQDPAAAKALGFQTIGLVQSGTMGSCAGQSASGVAAMAKDMANALVRSGMHLEELCNESNWNGVTPQTYAQWYDAAHEAIAGMGITLGAVGVWSYDGGSWMQQVIEELARIHHQPTTTAAREVDAWTIHPYGGDPLSSTFDTYLREARDQAMAYGSSAEWWITEWGRCIGTAKGGGSNCSPGIAGTVVSSEQQAADIREALDTLTAKYPWVTFFNYYMAGDGGDGQWGVFDFDCVTNGPCTFTPRPGFDAFKTWIAQHPSQVEP